MSAFTIGEVLNELRDEFTDVTISKIRFLESEGLISPDRTESGYRKFTPQDIERLRYVLRAQRDRYLPLKVIREELERIDAGLPPSDLAPPDPPSPSGQTTLDIGDDPPAAAPAPGPASGAAVAPGLPDAAELLAAETGERHLDAAGLAEQAGLDADELAELVDHGLLDDGPYGTRDLEVATFAARLLGSGLEVRHLRMYRQFAERELAIAEQLVIPLLRQRNPESRRRAADQAELLVTAGAALHRSLLADRLRAMLHT